MNGVDFSLTFDFYIFRIDSTVVIKEFNLCFTSTNIDKKIIILPLFQENTIIMFHTFPHKSVFADEHVTCRIDGREGNVSINDDGNSSCQIDIKNLATGKMN